jgi:tetratricopeptide (TPR) repeat protein
MTGPAPVSNGIDGALAEGIIRHRRGETAAAEARYSQALADVPAHPVALYLSGALAHETGRFGDARRLLGQACVVAPEVSEAAYCLGNLLQDQGALALAEVLYRAALARQPAMAEAWNNLATALATRGRLDAARAALLAAIETRPDYAASFANMAGLLLRSERPADALPCSARAVVLEPDHAKALFMTGEALRWLGRPVQAVVAYQRSLAAGPSSSAQYCLAATLIALGHTGAALLAARRAIVLAPAESGPFFLVGEVCRAGMAWDGAMVAYRRCLTIDPTRVDALNHLGNAWDEIGEHGRAEETLRLAVKLAPWDVISLNNLGTVLLQNGCVDAAQAAYRAALAIEPANKVSHYNLGNAYRQRLDVPRTLRSYRVATSIDPDYATAHWNDAITRLLAGDYREGWKKYEWRLRDRPAQMPRYAPTWEGEPLEGKRIVLLGEQGFGDMIQFARYALPLTREGRVVLECYRELRRLFSTLPAPLELLDMGEPATAVDFQVALMQLPRILGTRSDGIPAPVPYLAPPSSGPELPGGDRRGFKVGIVWAGSPRIERFHKRSATLLDFAPLLEVPGVVFYSLQVGARAADVTRLGLERKIIDLAPLIGDFGDTAHFVSKLDLVITVDTSVAHLAGALARPVWMMPTYVPDWRWMLDRTDTPWYPTMTLYRQAADRRWQPVVARLASDLSHAAAARG